MSEQMCRVTVEGEVREYRAGTSYQKIAEDFQSRYDHQIVLVFAEDFICRNSERLWNGLRT